jgi:hypothetical protein
MMPPGPVTHKPLRARWSSLAPPLLLVVICCAFYWRLTLSKEYTWLNSPDLVNMEVPRFQFQAQRWHLGAFPLWDPHLWCGQPFLGQIVGAANPVNWPFLRLPLEKSGKMALGVLHWYYVAIHCLGGLFAYFLCRDLKRSRAASLAGALVFALGGFFSGAPWPEVMGGILWAPLVFLFLLRALRADRPVSSAALCGLFLGAAWLSGHHEIPIYLSFTVATVWLYHMARDRTDRARLLGLAAVAAVVTMLTSGFQTVPGYEYAKLAKRWVGADHPVTWGDTIPYAVDVGASYRPGSLFNLFIPFLADDANDYLGVTALVLALTGALVCWKERGARLLTVVALSGLLLAMGGYNIFHGIAYAVLPLFGKARAPVRLLSLFDFAAAPLAAYGLDAMLAGGAARVVRGISIALAAMGSGMYAVALAAGLVHTYDPNEHVMFAGLVALLLAGVLALWQRSAVRERFLIAAVVSLMLAEFGLVTGSFSERSKRDGASVAEFTAYDDIAGYLKSRPELVRVDFQSGFNFGDWEGIDELNGFGAGVTSNLLVLDWPKPRVQDLLGVTYTVAKASNRPEQALEFHGASGFNVYRNPHAFPRTWTIHQTAFMKNSDQMRAAMADPGFDLRATAPMWETGPALETCASPDEAWVTGRNAGSVGFQARMGCRGMVVIADTWYPGWYATVDGRPAQIYEPYAALRGVVVEQGFHTIAMHYRPRSVMLGAAMSAAGILLACGLAMGGRMRRRPAG